MLRYVPEEIEKVEKHAKKALCIDGGSFDTRSLYARCIGYQGKYHEAIEMLKKLSHEKLSLRERTILLMYTTDFYRRRVEQKKQAEKDYLEAWNIFLEGVDFFENNLEKINTDKRIRERFVKLLLEGRQCIRQDKQGRKLDELKSAYESWINNHSEGWRLHSKSYE